MHSSKSVNAIDVQVSQNRLLLILGGLAALGPLSIDMYLPAFPSMALALGVTVDAVEASLASYLGGLAFGQLLYGPLADRLGRRPVLLFGLMLYGVSSVACAMAETVQTIVLLRFFQALGACGSMVVSRAVVRDCYDKQEAARMFSKLLLIMGAAPILAPLAGGYLATFLGWRSIFWFLVTFCVLCILAVIPGLPETRGPDPSVRFSRTLPNYWRLLRDRDFLRFALAGSIAQAGMFAYITGSPQVFIKHFGIEAENFGWLFGANAMGLIAMSQLNGRWLRRSTFAAILPTSFLVLSLSGIALLIAALLDGSLWSVAAPLFIYVAFLGATFPNTTAGALSTQSQNVGSASAMLGTIQMLAAATASTLVSRVQTDSAIGMAGTVAACGLIGTALYVGLRRLPKAD